MAEGSGSYLRGTVGATMTWNTPCPWNARRQFSHRLTDYLVPSSCTPWSRPGLLEASTTFACSHGSTSFFPHRTPHIPRSHLSLSLLSPSPPLDLPPV